MGSTALAANLFRATQTEEKLRREGIQGREEAIRRLGGTMPEHLPTPAESIAELRRKQRQLAERQATPLPSAMQGSLFDIPGDEEESS